jgi:hypothetical protein
MAYMAYMANMAYMAKTGAKAGAKAKAKTGTGGRVSQGADNMADSAVI